MATRDDIFKVVLLKYVEMEQRNTDKLILERYTRENWVKNDKKVSALRSRDGISFEKTV